MQRWAIPVSPDDPAGPNLEYDPDFGELERVALGTPEAILGNTVKAAEEPRWAEVERLAAGLLDRTRDLRVALHLTRARLRTDGLAGFAEGVALLEALLERFWDDVHPQLDADDDDDPTLRVNSLADLNAPGSTLRWLRETPIVGAPRIGRYGLRDLRIAEGRLNPIDDAPRPSVAEIDAAALEAPLDRLIADRDAAAAARSALLRIEALFTERARGAGPDFTPLRGDLQDIERFLAARIARRTSGTAGATDAANEPGGGGPAPTATASGVPASVEDIVVRLDEICAYYAQHEPSSPVPLLLERAKRLVGKDFLAIVEDLAPGGLSEARAMRGHVEG